MTKRKPEPARDITPEEIMQAECLLTAVECGGHFDDEELDIVLQALRRHLGRTVMPGQRFELDFDGRIFYVHNKTAHRLHIEGSFFQDGKPQSYDLVIAPHALDGKKKKDARPRKRNDRKAIADE